MPKGWPEVCREAEGRKWSAGQLATNHSQSEVGCRGWGWLSGGGICSHSKFAIYNQGTAFVGQSPLRNPHQKHKVSEIFLGLASWCDPQNSVGEQWEKTPSFPPVVPGRLFSVSSTWLQVKIPKWIWLKHLHLGHLKTSTLLTQQSSGLRNSQPAPARETHDILHNPVLIWITGWGRRGGGGGLCVWHIRGRLQKWRNATSTVFYRPCLLVLRSVLLFNGPPCHRHSCRRYFQNSSHRSRQHSPLNKPQVSGVRRERQWVAKVWQNWVMGAKVEDMTQFHWEK